MNISNLADGNIFEILAASTQAQTIELLPQRLKSTFNILVQTLITTPKT
ncbi:hypothetical protein [Nostoc sp.]